jgi:hypothetical protein
VAYRIGINKNTQEMFNDIHDVLVEDGWEKISDGLINSIKTSRGITFNGNAIAVEGKYADTIGMYLSHRNSLKHSEYSSSVVTTSQYFAEYPTNFSYSMWFNMANYNEMDHAWGTGADVSTNGNSLHVNQAFGCVEPAIYPAYSGITSTSVRLRIGVGLAFRKTGPVVFGHHISILPLLECFDLSGDMTGKSWMHLTITIDTTNSLMRAYLNGQEVPFDGDLTHTFRHTDLFGAIWGFRPSHSVTIDEAIVWNTVLSPAEVLSIYNSPVSIPSTDSRIFEKYTENIYTQMGGYYNKTTATGAQTTFSILANLNNNIELKTMQYGWDSSISFGEIKRMASYITLPSTSMYIAGVHPTSTVLKKYWVTAKNDRLIIATKLHNISANRTTPLYQIGYIGRISSVGSDGQSMAIAGNTTTSTYLWTTLNTTAFRNGLLYNTNLRFKIGSTYITPSVGAITTTLSSFVSISNSVFLNNISLYDTTNLYGVANGIYAVSSAQTNPEDVITINAIDYVVVDDADGTAVSGVRFAIRLE